MTALYHGYFNLSEKIKKKNRISVFSLNCVLIVIDYVFIYIILLHIYDNSCKKKKKEMLLGILTNHIKESCFFFVEQYTF